jgi:hypothetical protein
MARHLNHPIELTVLPPRRGFPVAAVTVTSEPVVSGMAGGERDDARSRTRDQRPTKKHGDERLLTLVTGIISGFASARGRGVHCRE